jgi:hypothetical protein
MPIPSPTVADSTTTGQQSAAEQAAAAAVAANGSEEPLAVHSGWFRRLGARHEVGAWFISAAVHASILVLMGLFVREVIRQSQPIDYNATSGPAADTALENLPPDANAGNGPADSPGPTPGALVGDDICLHPAQALPGMPELGPLTPHETTSGFSGPTDDDPLATLLLPQGHASAPFGQALAKGGGGLGGRLPGRRGELASTRGGSKESEAAVENGLKWLLAHQHPDGSWRFSFDGDPCNNLCTHGGVETSTTGATAMALLPFFGAGYTHEKGPYAEQVNRGLYYLGSHMLVTPQGGDLQEGTMYAQGLSTITLCEAYGMSKDPTLRPYAQKAVDYILYAQDHTSGGWRYFPGQAGDTTVTGWQLMALKSAQMAGLETSSQAFFLANKFLDSVQSDKGAAYGYITPGEGNATTSVGLLCRMYLGWSRNHPALTTGVVSLDKLGPSSSDLYYDYYATQVMFHHGGPQWDRWNTKMRDYLIKTQSTEGHESGSWYFPDRHLDKGGRLCNTSLAILTLEVYYRYLPIYSNKAVDEAF